MQWPYRVVIWSQPLHQKTNRTQCTPPQLPPNITPMGNVKLKKKQSILYPSLPFIKSCICLFQMESSTQEIHKSLNSIIDYQTHHRLREAQGRKRAEDLNERVMWWSILETLAVLIITVGQVLVLKNFFAEKKPSQMNSKQRATISVCM